MRLQQLLVTQNHTHRATEGLGKTPGLNTSVILWQHIYISPLACVGHSQKQPRGRGERRKETELLAQKGSAIALQQVLGSYSWAHSSRKWSRKNKHLFYFSKSGLRMHRDVRTWWGTKGWRGIRQTGDEMVVMLQSAWPSPSEWYTVVLSASGLFALGQLAEELLGEQREQTARKRFLQQHRLGLSLGQQKRFICVGW